MLLDTIRSEVRLNLAKSNREDFYIRGLWAVDCLFNPDPKERVFNYKFIVAQTIGQGCAYSPVTQYDVNVLKELIGKNYLDIQIDDIGLEIAILDSIFSTHCSTANEEFELRGDSIQKATKRAEIIAQEAFRLIPEKRHPKISNVGVVGNIIKQLLDRGADVVGSDFDAEIIGTKLFEQAEIVDGKHTLDIIRESDVAIVTGMTLATETLDKIIETAQKYDTKVLIFAETGANLSDFYIRAGVNTVVSEPFPFYIFQGKNTIKVYRKHI